MIRTQSIPTPPVRARSLALALALLASLLGGMTALAAPATPVSSGCTVAARSEAELARLAAATPAASPTSTPLATLPSGTAVDPAVVDALQQTLTQVQACEASGSVEQLLALFSDAYVVNVAFAPEPVKIVPGTPVSGGGEAVATPSAQPDLLIADATMLADGRIAASVVAASGSTSRSIVIFVKEAGMWRIDAIAPESGGGDATPAASLPAPVDAALQAAATKLNVDPSTLTIVSSERTEWPDASLGCPEPGKLYAQVITPGWLVVIGGPGQELEYHTNASSRAVLCTTTVR